MPAADFCRQVREGHPSLSPVSRTDSRSPEVSSTAFRTQPPNLHPAPSMDMGFAVISPLARRRMPHIRFLSIGPYVCSTLPSDPPSPKAPLRFAITSPPSGCEGDFHPQAVDHARHTEKGEHKVRPYVVLPLFRKLSAARSRPSIQAGDASACRCR
jgi:hypothetical protein